MIPIIDFIKYDFDAVPVDTFWNTSDQKEMKMHRIHSYPAKFPSFITTKALDYAQQSNFSISKIADIFCGCGTTAFEAKRNGIDFWGCDINPVATLIAKTKSHQYAKNHLEDYYKSIMDSFLFTKVDDVYGIANERLKYWFSETQYNKLQHLKTKILENTPAGSCYQDFFLCAFSNILKATSFWLTKSIKPQIDPNKKPADVETIFKMQCRLMISANDEMRNLQDTTTDIHTCNFLESDTLPPKVDMIITSPPYVTSYEYADLHQLSSLWLNYTDDYRDLRKGTIGSLYHEYNLNHEIKRLNNVGSNIVLSLFDKDKSKARSVAKYFHDMQKVAKKAFKMLNDDGLALFIIGNTEYKGVRIDNAKHLAESLGNAGFREMLVSKRKISKKILTPYRNSLGKFSSDSTGRKVYNEEFILIGKK